MPMKPTTMLREVALKYDVNICLRHVIRPRSDDALEMVRASECQLGK